MPASPHKVAVVGATGVVGREMLAVLEQRNYPASEVVALASARSVGARLPFRGGELVVREAKPDEFAGVKVALFSAGAAIARELGPAAAAHGAVVIDNSSAWRMDPEVPLVVPEVNIGSASKRVKGIIANPNCSTIQLVVALKPLHDAARITHVVVSTYQAASGKGQAAVADMLEQARALAAGETPVASVFPGVLAQNLLMDWKTGSGDHEHAADWSEEELKMVNETRKILGEPRLSISATTVRVPVVTGHSESVHLRFERAMTATEARELLSKAPGVKLDPAGYAPGRHAQPARAAGTDDVFVGRIRNDIGDDTGLNLWVVADNLRKGAALNAVQIAEHLEF